MPLGSEPQQKIIGESQVLSTWRKPVPLASREGSNHHTPGAGEHTSCSTPRPRSTCPGTRHSGSPVLESCCNQQEPPRGYARR